MSSLVTMSLLVCLLEYEIPRTGTKSLTCVSPGPGIVSTWLESFPFSSRGQGEGVPSIEGIKTIIDFPTEGREGFANRSCYSQAHIASSLCWRGSRQGIQGYRAPDVTGPKNLPFTWRAQSAQGMLIQFNLHSIHAAGRWGHGRSTWETSEFLETWVRRRMLLGGAMLGRCRRDTRSPQRPRPLLTLDGQPSPAVCEGSLQHIQFSGELTFIAGISFFFITLVPWAKDAGSLLTERTESLTFMKGSRFRL